MCIAVPDEEMKVYFNDNHQPPCLDGEKEPFPVKLHLRDSFYRFIRYY